MLENQFLLLLLAYLIGTIPFGLLLTRACGLGDIRSIGSGNIGATNVMRTGNKKLGIATLLLDLCKGLGAVYLAMWLSPDIAAVAGLCAVLGHIFPVWLKFKGGKGVATALGVFFALNWVFALSVCAMWLIVFKISKISSLSALSGFLYAPFAGFFMLDATPALVCAMLSIIIFYTHRANIKRLINGEELGFKGKKS